VTAEIANHRITVTLGIALYSVADRAECTLRIVWDDGHESVYPTTLLRWSCPCALCSGEWGRPGRLTQIAAPDGQTWRLAYTGSNLTQIFDPLHGGSTPWQTFAYQPDNRGISRRLSEVRDEIRSLLEGHSYDTLDRASVTNQAAQVRASPPSLGPLGASALPSNSCVLPPSKCSPPSLGRQQAGGERRNGGAAQVQFSLISKGPQQMETKAICDQLGIRLIAYSPLGLGGDPAAVIPSMCRRV